MNIPQKPYVPQRLDPLINLVKCTYRVVIKNEGVLVLVEIVQRPLRDAVLYFD